MGIIFMISRNKACVCQITQLRHFLRYILGPCILGPCNYRLCYYRIYEYTYLPCQVSYEFTRFSDVFLHYRLIVMSYFNYVETYDSICTCRICVPFVYVYLFPEELSWYISSNAQ